MWSGHDTFQMTYDNYPPTLVHGGGGNRLSASERRTRLSKHLVTGWCVEVARLPSRRGVSPPRFPALRTWCPAARAILSSFATQPNSRMVPLDHQPSGNDTQIVYRGTSSVPLMVNLQDRWATGIRQFDGNAKFVSKLAWSVVMGRNADVTWQVDTSTGQVNDDNWCFGGFSARFWPAGAATVFRSRPAPHSP